MQQMKPPRATIMSAASLAGTDIFMPWLRVRLVLLVPTVSLGGGVALALVRGRWLEAVLRWLRCTGSACVAAGGGEGGGSGPEAPATATRKRSRKRESAEPRRRWSG